MLDAVQVVRCFCWGKRSIFPVDQKPVGRVFFVSYDIRPTNIAMKYLRVSMACLTTALVNEVEASQDYLESFKDAHYSISDIRG